MNHTAGREHAGDAHRQSRFGLIFGKEKSQMAALIASPRNTSRIRMKQFICIVSHFSLFLNDAFQRHEKEKKLFFSLKIINQRRKERVK